MVSELREYDQTPDRLFFTHQPANGTKKMRHIISVLMQNEAGALARVVALFSARGYNIESLSVAPTEDKMLSRLTLVTRGSDAVIEQINQQLLKLVDVVVCADMTRDNHIERELLLMKVAVSEQRKTKLSNIITAAGARVLDDCPANYTLEFTAANIRMDDFITDVAAHSEVLAVVRSGAMAIARGDQVLSTES
jgi:acetolactate synthase-1/3 small subunit